MELVFASHNQNKVLEIQKIVGAKFEILSLNDISFREEIEETGKTFFENALIKAEYVSRKYMKDCFADDSGLEVVALNNEPGVFSARYAGEPKNDYSNIMMLLKKMEQIEDRRASFRTVIALKLQNQIHYFEGLIHGEITRIPIGENGFGYDPIFIPKGYNKTFAEMTLDEKSSISHRALATKKLADFLVSQV